MTEPVAYWRVPKTGAEDTCLNFSPSKNPNFENIPLYTAEQLHKRVKMTQAEFEEFNILSESGIDTIYDILHLVKSDRVNSVTNLYERLFDGDFITVQKSQLEFANLWAYYDPENPEDMIDIIPTNKWFVRVDSQIPLPNENIYLDDELIVYPRYDSPKSSAHQFDTKEEAEKWVNPLTKAVQLPVEDS